MEQMFKRVNHIGIAVKDLRSTIKFYSETFGLKSSAVREVPSQGVKIAMITVGDLKLELLEPFGEHSPISNFLAKRGQGLHHITFEVDEMEKNVAEIKQKGVRTLSELPSVGYDGKPIIFLHPKDTGGVLIEIEKAASK